MQWTDRIRQVKIVLLVSAVVIAAVSLVISYLLVRDLSHEERNRMVVWAEAMRSLSSADENTDIYLALKVINGNNTIPVIVLDAQGNVETYRNITIKAETAADTLRYLQQRAESMRQAGYAIDLNLTDAGQEVRPGDDYLVICYEESSMLRRLASYPYVQLGVVGLFVVVAIFALLSSKRAEQNRVWVGLSKETAHQLGTPISSLMAWTAILREAYPDDELIPEMDKDVKRLELIADRFSKIGSQPEVAKTYARCLNGLPIISGAVRRTRWSWRATCPTIRSSSMYVRRFSSGWLKTCARMPLMRCLARESSPSDYVGRRLTLS